MKNYHEMASAVFDRINAYEIKKKNIRKRTVSYAAFLSLACIIIFTGINFSKGVIKDDKDSVSTHISISYTYTEKLRARVNELKSYGADKIGWLFYGNSLYVQNQSMSYSEIEKLVPNEFLGNAEDFEGAYRYAESCSGRVYSVKEKADMILVLLDNGGKGVLQIEIVK